MFKKLGFLVLFLLMAGTAHAALIQNVTVSNQIVVGDLRTGMRNLTTADTWYGVPDVIAEDRTVLFLQNRGSYDVYWCIDVTTPTIELTHGQMIPSGTMNWNLDIADNLTVYVVCETAAQRIHYMEAK